MSKGIFITATGTDVGKTFVTGLIVKKLRDAGYKAGYYKAALSGAEVTENGLIPGDADYVNRVANIGEKIENLVSYVYEKPVSPHLAARIEGNPVEMDVVKAAYKKAASQYDYVTVEGSGGIICPIRYDDIKIMLEDIIEELDLSTVIIADAGLGTINAAVLTVEYMRQKNISMKGIIFNHCHEGNVMEEDNKKMVEIMTGLPVLAFIKNNDTELNMDADKLVDLYD
ncbi:dethiobiotin synthase [Desulfosporosinus sp. BICA1-9]|uniref:dethiobiotin synthase n=1 Tax=Desulfosporosinus sp. BICA1-9 TaxID=1531958 RepID=UPI00054BA07F|nr:dethiobiotin synthase [Desulfosporosinus sp. BICA1-9]KJS49639.1 MAG: dethiobiotin synthetase [Peptococcaceae bacterium BRH_c23]KJS81261.1 MAG: dethiobiotin synthetase [Desulfosporosinus sp. BICA1-9]HBW36726.1 dethiobiotin synthase [Desulfosporosinus sp.]